MYSSRDRTITQIDIDALFQNVNTQKNLVAFPHAGHELLVKADRQLWQKNVTEFLNNIKHLLLQSLELKNLDIIESSQLLLEIWN